jgi:hypothetical protein
MVLQTQPTEKKIEVRSDQSGTTRIVSDAPNESE